MNETSLFALSAHFGIQPNFYDLDGHLVDTSVDTQLALLGANGLQIDNDSDLEAAVREYVIVEQERWFPRELVTSADYDFHCNFGLGAEWHLVLDEDLTVDEVAAVQVHGLEGRAGDHIILPPLPAGIHELIVSVSGRTEKVTIIAAPIRAPSIEELCGKEKLWGLNTALYGLRSGRNAGLGDFEDLAKLGDLLNRQGASFVGVNPVHSLGFSDPYTISPYSPSHRAFLNSLHIALDCIPAVSDHPKAKAILSQWENRFSALRQASEVDYSGHRVLHNDIMRDLYTLFVQYATPEQRAGFEAFRKARGAELEKFALYESLSEKHGTDWHRWPDALKRQDPIVLEVEADQMSSRIGFYSWVQWVADCQLAEAQSRATEGGKGLGLYLDLAVGARNGGAESWCEAGSVARGVALGAPPDHLAPGGQNWGLTAFAPKRLAQDKYRALRRTYREAMRHAGLLRIDHVLGLNRSFWIPDNGAPGAYVSQPLDIFLAILAIEAKRSSTALVGEDLGLVPDGFREKVKSRGIYGYSVLQYEKEPNGDFVRSEDLRQFSLACFSTHDTPTLRGFASGRDIDWWQKLNTIDEQVASGLRDSRAQDVERLLAKSEQKPDDNASNELRDEILFRSIHEDMASSPVAMISVQLDDILGEVEAQNLPGTIDEHPNWRRRCKLEVDDIEANEKFDWLCSVMRQKGRSAR